MLEGRGSGLDVTNVIEGASCASPSISFSSCMARRKASLSLDMGIYLEPARTAVLRTISPSSVAQGVDFIVSVLDLAGSGVVQAAEEADPALNVRVTTGFSIFPESKNWATATLFKPTEQILQLAKEVEEGKLGGAITLAYGLYGSGAPRTTYLPILNVSDEINAQVLQVCKDLAAGKIEVSSDTTKME